MNATPLFVILLLVGTAGSALGQGTLEWGNFFTDTLRAPVYGPIPNYPTCVLTGNTPTGIPAGTQDYGGAPLLSGTGFTMAIFDGGSESEARAAISHLGSAPFRSGLAAGFVNSFTVTDPVRPPGTTGVHVQFRAWDNQNGTITSWAQVLASGGMVPFGYSDVFTIGPLGGTDQFGMTHPTPLTTGFRSFNLSLTGLGPGDLPGCPVPEPSTWVILAGAGSLFLACRRR
ncbi:MAG TPA: PEP-CTERM sorting domain-containing protein [Verrucomicrobiae bacterium]|nr:PEP-CTERM sorting domain-containing protein [Verrucomicrobiae bacterium]